MDSLTEWADLGAGASAGLHMESAAVRWLTMSARVTLVCWWLCGVVGRHSREG